MSDNEHFEPVVLSGEYDPDPPLAFRERRFGFGHLQAEPEPDQQADDDK